MIKFKTFFKWMAFNLVITLLLFYFLDRTLNYSNKNVFIIAHSPLMIQLISSLIACRLKWKNSFSKIIFISTIFFIIFCLYYNLNFVNFIKNKYYPEDFSINLICLEIIFQVYLLILLSIFYIKKNIRKYFLVDAFKIMFPTFLTVCFGLLMYFQSFESIFYLNFIIMIVLIINIFNPVLIYILSAISEGEIFIENEK